NNPNLQAIPGLQALDGVGGDISITDNFELPTCVAAGLVEELAFIGGGVLISGNLPDACGG
ncbi:MAG TPA: hypothetical protein VK034_15515, partial [Enhygromyxa sp.]|nr:hypothetical protein [Enhygromyxa sp.]